MRRYGAFALAALLCSAAAPSFAAWDRIGSVQFSVRDSHDTSWGNFRGDSVALTARDGDVACRDIEARFDDGGAHTVFRGTISNGQTVNVGIPGNAGVHRLDFDCHPTNNWRARVDVAANVPDFNGQRFGYGYGRERSGPQRLFDDLGRMFGR
jgi:hypothetical protein